MISLSKIFKGRNVTFDKDNKILIDANPALQYEDNEDENSFEAVNEPIRETPEQQADKIIKAAQHEADSIIRKAKEKAEQEAGAIGDQAYEQGYQEGMDLASAEGDAIKAQAQKVLLDAHEERKVIISKIESEIVDLIIKITGKMINDIVELRPDLIAALIKQGFSGSNLNGEVFVHVSPQDYDTAMEHKDELLALTDSSTRLEITKDPSLKAMDCIIETSFGNVDCSLNQGYEALVQNLKFLLNN
jgi:flagellar assembly protein FliH